MCSYNITLSDTLVEKVRPSFADDNALQLWLQQQVEEILLNLSLRQETKIRARKAVAAMRQQSENNGNPQLTLDEINAEIRQARQKQTEEQAIPDAVLRLLGAGLPLDDDDLNGRKAYYQHLEEKYQ